MLSAKETRGQRIFVQNKDDSPSLIMWYLSCQASGYIYASKTLKIPYYWSGEQLECSQGRAICAKVLRMVIPALIINRESGNPFNGYINPYYWVDEFIPYGNDLSLDSLNARRSYPHCENAPDTGGGVTSLIEQVPYSCAATFSCFFMFFLKIYGLALYQVSEVRWRDSPTGRKPRIGFSKQFLWNLAEARLNQRLLTNAGSL